MNVGSSGVYDVDVDAPPTRRDRRRERARDELLGSARALIAERGIAELRVSDITERIDVSLGSFYKHFETKDAVIDAVVGEAVSALADAIGDVGDHIDDPAEAMGVGIRQLIGMCETDPALARLLVRLEDAEPRFETLVWHRAERILLRGIESGRLRASDPTLTLTMATGAVLATIRAIVDGRAHRATAAVECARAILLAVEITPREADALLSRPLPSLGRDT